MKDAFDADAHNALRDCVMAQTRLGVLRQYIDEGKTQEAFAAIAFIKVWLNNINHFIQSNHCCFDESHSTLQRVEVENT